MTPERWQQIKAVLEAVDSAPLAERPGIVDRLCDGDSDLRREVEPFLAEVGGGTFIKGAISEQAASVTTRQERFYFLRFICLGMRISVCSGQFAEILRIDNALSIGVRQRQSRDQQSRDVAG